MVIVYSENTTFLPCYHLEDFMKRLAFLAMVIVLILTVSVPGSAMNLAAAPTWNSTIYYYNPDAVEGSMTASFVGSPTIPLDITKTILAHGFGQISVGSTGDFKGSAILSANIPLAAVYKQSDANNGAYAPVLYTSFDASRAGTSGKFYLPTVLHEGYYVSKVGIQNVETEEVKLTLEFYDGATGQKVPTTLGTITVPAEGSYVFEVTDTDVPGIGSSFNGSLVIIAKKTSNQNNARVVAAVEELQSQGQRSYAFEGSGVAAPIIFMPSVSCKYSTLVQTSYLAVQNAGDVDTSITVKYYGYNGALLATHAVPGILKPGAKVSINTCDAKVYSRMKGKVGTARVISLVPGTTSTYGTPIVAIGKITSSAGLTTAYLGQLVDACPVTVPPTPTCTHRVLLPYVEYNKLSTGLRTTLYVMNNSSTTAKKVYIRYYYFDKATSTYKYQQVTLASSTAPIKKYGYKAKSVVVTGAALDNGIYVGAAEVISDQPVVVVTRVYKSVTGVPGVTRLGEDYIGIPYSALP
jgi:hypothetical protein